MAFIRFRRRPVPRSRFIGATLTALVAFAVIFVAGSSANLAGSTFEGNDGNLVVNTPGNTDWVNAPNRVRGDDLASGGTDNSFGGGTKEDDPNVTVVTGSIPPMKSDLTRFYVASEFASNSNFLYLAWERSNVLRPSSPATATFSISPGSARMFSARRTWTSSSTGSPSPI